jgi:hypothetical protein
MYGYVSPFQNRNESTATKYSHRAHNSNPMNIFSNNNSMIQNFKPQNNDSYLINENNTNNLQFSRNYSSNNIFNTPTDRKMVMLQDQVRLLEQKRIQERNNLLDIINKNISMSNDKIGPMVGIYNPYLGIGLNKPLMGINPTFLSNKQNSKTKSIIQQDIDEVKPHDSKIIIISPEEGTGERSSRLSIKKETESNNTNNITNNTNNNTNNINNLTQKAVEELSKNIMDLKDDITAKIHKLKRNQDKMRFNEMLDELSEFREVFRKSLKKSNENSKYEIETLKNKFNSIKNEIQNTLTKEKESNKSLLNTMTNEVKDYQSQLKQRIEELENKQKLHMEGLQRILDNSSDDKTRELAKRFLSGDEESLKTTYMKPQSNEVDEVVKDLMKKSNAFDGRRKTQMVEAHLRKVIDKRKIVNQHLEESAKTKENFADKSENSKLLRSVTKRIETHLINEEEYKLTGINKFRRAVYAVMACRRFKSMKRENMRISLFDFLKQFTMSYSQSYELLKNYMNETVKVSFNSIFNFSDLDLDISNKKYSKNDSDLKNKYIKLEVRVKEFLVDLTTNVSNIPKESYEFLKLLISGKGYIPLQFFSLFELCRLEISNESSLFPGCYIENMKEKHQAMVLSFFFLLKILVKHFMVDKNFPKSVSITDLKVKNLKIIASIIYNECIELYREHCPFINSTKAVNYFVSNQSIFKNKKGIYFDTKKLNKNKTDIYYLEALENMNNNRLKGMSSFIENENEEKEIFSKFYRKLPNYGKDQNPDGIDYLSDSLFKPAELASYYIMSKENKFDLKILIFQWVKKLIKILKES